MKAVEERKSEETSRRSRSSVPRKWYSSSRERDRGSRRGSISLQRPIRTSCSLSRRMSGGFGGGGVEPLPPFMPGNGIETGDEEADGAGEEAGEPAEEPSARLL